MKIKKKHWQMNMHASDYHQHAHDTLTPEVNFWEISCPSYPKNWLMFTQVPCNQLHLCSFARIFFFTFIALFSNGYKYHTQWSYPRCIYCGLVFLLKKRTLLQWTIIGEGIESAMCSTSAIIDISDELNLRIWTCIFSLWDLVGRSVNRELTLFVPQTSEVKCP